MSLGARARPAFVAALATLVLAGDALACSCIAAPIEERLDDADAAVVGRVVAEREVDVRGVRQRLLTFEVDQRVKGDVEKTLEVRTPLDTSCDVTIAKEEVTGLLLTRSPDGVWLANLCSLVDEGQLVAAGGEPRGGAIKVVIGIVILAIAPSCALPRKARGERPDLPGAPVA